MTLTAGGKSISLFLPAPWLEVLMLALKQKLFHILASYLFAMVVAGAISYSAFRFLANALTQYITLQEDGSAFTDVSLNSQRIAAVLRGGTRLPKQVTPG